ncbi:uncharacterized protein LOC128988112 [Macrosteles quadrilineatus]|uniref:uncharacterized protein LOC128983068 n=1 Tax=Macrosteles quadrilineatus TaxID=74068 RepID=UPI0023E14B88|nr:uncharacterized protein LOC128983068 [Macrosteles quadrilineatus]XP_054265337.1 uncharacterized protein LOC128988112 [Macrosteles quadrilineatus]
MSKFNLNYLIKEELTYELLSRGQDIINNDVQSLRRQLRLCQDVPTNVINLKGKIILKDEFDTIGNKLYNVEELIGQCKETNSNLLVAKIKAKLAHLALRISHMKLCKLEESFTNRLTDFVDKLQKSTSQFEAILNDIPQEELAEFEERLNTSILDEEEIDSEINKHVVHDRQTSSTPTQHNTQTLEVVQDFKPIEIPFNNRLGPQVQPLAGPSQEIENVNVFGKIKNPLENYLQKFRICNGLEIYPLLDFLRNLITITIETNLTSHQLFEILPTYTSQPLTNKILEHKNTNQSIDRLHTDIINTFIPITLKEKLKQELIFRPQKTNEPLSIYINEVKTNHQVLKGNLTEEELVCFIKNGIHPEIRNKLVFEKNPITFRDLDQLCINLNNVNFNDYVRHNMFPTTSNTSSGHMHNRSIENQGNHGYGQTSSGTSYPRDRVCYNCARPGHTARQCFRKPKNS